MNNIGLLFIILFYLLLLFAIAYWAERKNNSNWTNNAYIYTLSIAVYCTAWTYYGSIGVAAKSGLNYLAIYIGPVIIIPIWIILLRKIIRISRINKISSIADFISLRYGNSRLLGALVAIVCTIGVLPYIALQLKAISETFHIVTFTKTNKNILFDFTSYIAVILAIFTSYYGTKYSDASEKRNGIITAVAFESIIKLLFFVIIGIYVTFFVFDGYHDIFTKAKNLSNFNTKNTINGLDGAINWFFLCLMSMFAIFLLPRQFQTSVVENKKEKHLKTVIWLLPLYLFIFNIFVFPIAWGGNILFENKIVNSDMYSLLIPLHKRQLILTIMVFLGGFSAAISMVVVSTIALSTMLSNNFFIPYNLLGRLKNNEDDISNKKIINLRKIIIFLLIMAAFFIYRLFVLDFSLVSIGLISFVIIAQLAPSFFGSLFWRRGSSVGAIIGLILGFLVVFFTLLLPYNEGLISENNAIATGYFDIEMLKPFQLFGLNYLQPIPHSLFWSLSINFFCYFFFSINFKSNYRERNYAEMYVNVDKYISNHENAYIWKGEAYYADIEKVLIKFLGKERTERALKLFKLKYNIQESEQKADAKFIKFAENLLTGYIGTASAKILISNVSKEEEITLQEVLKILEESNQNIQSNKKLMETTKELENLSKELQLSNQKLIEKDQQKDDFLDTVTHELRTPIAAIRASSEILIDEEEIPLELKNQFLSNIISESDRLNKLINKILDLERLDAGNLKLNKEIYVFTNTIHKAIEPLLSLINSNIILENNANSSSIKGLYDEERIIQVINNLMSNAIKFCENNGKIILNLQENENFITFSIFNNGKNIEEDEINKIFDKFYQSKNQTLNKPIGSGLGLAISQKIIQQHNGILIVENKYNGIEFLFKIPLNQ